MSEKILLIDGNSMANRAFYATMGRMMKIATFTGWQTMPPSVRYGLII